VPRGDRKRVFALPLAVGIVGERRLKPRNIGNEYVCNVDRPCREGVSRDREFEARIIIIGCVSVRRFIGRVVGKPPREGKAPKIAAVVRRGKILRHHVGAPIARRRDERAHLRAHDAVPEKNKRKDAERDEQHVHTRDDERISQLRRIIWGVVPDNQLPSVVHIGAILPGQSVTTSS
jgi:hypothetical protein